MMYLKLEPFAILFQLTDGIRPLFNYVTRYSLLRDKFHCRLSKGIKTNLFTGNKTQTASALDTRLQKGLSPIVPLLQLWC